MKTKKTTMILAWPCRVSVMENDAVLLCREEELASIPAGPRSLAGRPVRVDDASDAEKFVRTWGKNPRVFTGPVREQGFGLFAATKRA